MRVRNIIFNVAISGEEGTGTHEHDCVPLEVVRFERGQIEPLLIAANPFETSLNQTFVRLSIRSSVGGSICRGGFRVQPLQPEGGYREVRRHNSLLDGGRRKQLWNARRVLAEGGDGDQSADQSHFD